MSRVLIAVIIGLTALASLPTAEAHHCGSGIYLTRTGSCAVEGYSRLLPEPLNERGQQVADLLYFIERTLFVEG